MKSKKNTHDFSAPGINLAEDLTAKLISLNLELEGKNRQLRESEQAREHILSNISHDLRAPLAAVRGAVDRLSAGVSDPLESQKLAEIISRRVSVLEKLIDELYFSIKLEQPEFALTPEILPVGPFLEEYFITLETAGSFKDRRPALSLPEGLELYAGIDVQYFLRVLDNLFSNALRHTDAGDLIELGCRAAGEAVEIYLKDSGEGISPENLPHIFERTFTASRARTPGESGSGLGLYIAQSIVEKHGGKISCEASPGNGAVFTITLPRLYMTNEATAP